MKRFIYTSLIWLCGWKVIAQSTEEKQLTVQQLTEDFARFQTAIKEVHPGQYRYTSKTRFDSLFVATAKQLNRPMIQREFYLLMQPLVVALRCGHTKWIVAGRDEHYPFFPDKLFPVRLFFAGQQAWIVDNAGHPIPAGAEVVSINGQRLTSIIQRLLPTMTSSDGFGMTAKYEDLNQYFAGYFATHYGPSETFRITYRTNSDEQTVTLPAVNEATLKANIKPSAMAPFRLSINDPQTAVMTINQFWSDHKADNYKKFLAEAFQQLARQNIQHLILDIRNNEGGEEAYGVRLFSYLIDKPSPYYDRLVVRQKEKHSFPAWSPRLYRLARKFVVKET